MICESHGELLRLSGGAIAHLSCAALLGAMLAVTGCASGPKAPGEGVGIPHVLLLYGDARADGVLAFPDSAYEALIRFDLEAGQGVPRRIWYRPSSAGMVMVSVYEASALDGPGAAIEQHQNTIPADVPWDASSGRWLVQDLTTVAPIEKATTLWVGIKKLAETPGLWCSDRDAGHYYMRSSDPSRRVSLVPVRRAPLVQLELSP